MQQAADYVASAKPVGFKPASAPATINQAAVNNPRLYREVFGFFYASSLADPTIGYQSWNFDLLSTVAYFGVHVDAWSGVLVSDSGLYIWNNPASAVPALIRTAHAHGVKVILTLIMMDTSPGTPSMCAALQFSDATVQAAVAQVKAKASTASTSTTRPATRPATTAGPARPSRRSRCSPRSSATCALLSRRARTCRWTRMAGRPAFAAAACTAGSSTSALSPLTSTPSS